MGVATGCSFLPRPGINIIMGEKLGDADIPPQPPASRPAASKVAKPTYLKLTFTPSL
jgi:hypothetical protein